MPENRLSPADLDKFCRDALSELAVYFYAAESGTREGAHEKLHKSAAAVGQNLASLEEALKPWLNEGFLIAPRRKTIEQTEAGALTHEFAAKILSDIRAFVDRLYDLQHDTRVRVVSIHSAWMAHGAELEARFAREIPGGTVSVRHTGCDGSYPTLIMSEVRDGKADIGITSFPCRPSPGLILQRLTDRELVLVFSAKYSQLPKPEAAVHLADVIRRNDKLKVAVHQRSLDNPLHNRVINYLTRLDADYGPSQLREGYNIAEIKENIQRFPNTISILPEDTVEQGVREGSLVTFKLDPPLKPWPWAFYYKEGTTRQPVLKFIECLRPFFQHRPNTH
jgi:DNA-binding transcriptional LysR family regulator